MDSCFIQNLYLRASIQAQGAELCRLHTLNGMELLWDGNPAVWPRFAPNLFPIVGQLKGDTLRHRGRTYPMGRHGFARDARFEIVKLTREDTTLVLRDNRATRSVYPFPFELRINFRLDGLSLNVVYELINTGQEPLPASLGAHPALRWPLVPGTRREDYRLKFEVPEDAPVRRLVNGLLDPQPRPTPVQDRVLPLRDQVFQEDAIIFDRLRSHKVRLDAPGSVGLEVSWEGFEQLGVWTKPGAGFVCIEPWRGFASPADFDGEFTEKPGILLLPPGGRRFFRYSITLIHAS